MKKALVISGGGAYGAYGAGTLKRLDEEYDFISGVSTGALMAPLVALRKWDVLEEAYTTTRNKDIFDGYWGNPFNKKGKIRPIKGLIRAIGGLIGLGMTLGTTKSLRRHIDKFVSVEDYNEIRKRGIDVQAVAQDLTTSPGKAEHFSILSESFSDFKDWMWASSNVPPVMTILDKRDIQWGDGGLTEAAAIAQAVECGVDEVHVIIHRQNPDLIKPEKKKVKTIIPLLTRVIQTMRDEINRNDVLVGVQEAQLKGVKVKIWWLPRKLSNNSLVFNREEMTQWFQEGYDTVDSPERYVEYDFGADI